MSLKKNYKLNHPTLETNAETIVQDIKKIHGKTRFKIREIRKYDNKIRNNKDKSQNNKTSKIIKTRALSTVSHPEIKKVSLRRVSNDIHQYRERFVKRYASFNGWDSLFLSRDRPVIIKQAKVLSKPINAIIF